MIPEVQVHQRLFLQSCNGIPTPEGLRRALLTINDNPEYADKAAAHYDLKLQQQRLNNGRSNTA